MGIKEPSKAMYTPFWCLEMCKYTGSQVRVFILVMQKKCEHNEQIAKEENNYYYYKMDG